MGCIRVIGKIFIKINCDGQSINCFGDGRKILNKIYLIRRFKVMLDVDLAEMYLVETKQLKRQVRRNIERFLTDFMFELDKEKFENLRC
ncbi:MAG TPA: ORF6N domain-containing protein [Hanamia sp.]